MTQAQTNVLNPQELIAFTIGEQEFCVDIRSVREIRGWTPATSLPQSPAYVRGVINLRGAVLPIIDLSCRLGLGTATPSARHVIIVARVGLRTVGLLVEAVSDILTVSDETIQATPDIAWMIASLPCQSAHGPDVPNQVNPSTIGLPTSVAASASAFATSPCVCPPITRSTASPAGTASARSLP